MIYRIYSVAFPAESQITSSLLKTLKAVPWAGMWRNAAEAHQRPVGLSTVGDLGQKELLNLTVRNQDCESSNLKDLVRKDAPLPGRAGGGGGALCMHSCSRSCRARQGPWLGALRLVHWCLHVFTSARYTDGKGRALLLIAWRRRGVDDVVTD